jgi:hypothetical protein
VKVYIGHHKTNTWTARFENGDSISFVLEETQSGESIDLVMQRHTLDPIYNMPDRDIVTTYSSDPTDAEVEEDILTYIATYLERDI